MSFIVLCTHVLGSGAGVPGLSQEVRAASVHGGREGVSAVSQCSVVVDAHDEDECAKFSL